MSTVLDAVLDLVGAKEVWDSLGVLCGVRGSVVGADTLVLESFDIAIIDEAAARLLIKAEKTAGRDLVETPCLLGTKVDFLRVDREVRLGRDSAEEGGQGDHDGCREIHCD